MLKPYDYKKKKPEVNVEDLGDAPQEVVFKYLRGKKGEPGEPAHTPTEEELLALIEPLIPEAIPGDDGTDGEDYILTEKDKKEIAQKVKVPVVEKVVEKREVVKEVGPKYTPPEIRDMLESLKKGEKLSIQAIEGLQEILEELSRRGKEKGISLGSGGIHASASRDIRFIDDETPSGTVDGSNAVFTIAKTPRVGSLKVYRGGGRQRVTEDYTFSGKTITFTLAPQVGEVILVDYRY